MYLISYDIRDPRRLQRVAKIMVNYGNRVQYSVFECLIDNKMYEKLIHELKKVIDEDEDTIRSYELCKMCLKRVQILGQGELTEDKEYYIF